MSDRGMKAKLRRIAAGLVILAGLLMVSYPWLSNWILERQIDSQVRTWQAEMEEQKEDGALAIRRMEAEAYNEQLAESHVQLTDPFVPLETDTEDLLYERMISSGHGEPMCFVEIPAIDVYLPVYHGTSPEVLEQGIGHLEGSALPIGGEGNHSVLSGHTGLNNARLFTDLILLEEGDRFFLHVLGETLVYRVERILVIEPEDTGCLIPETGRDLVSLLTCTPYGVNTHRLVVTGERITQESSDMLPDSELESSRQSSSRTDSVWLTSYRRALAIGCGIVWVLFLILTLFRRWRNRK